MFITLLLTKYLPLSDRVKTYPVTKDAEKKEIATIKSILKTMNMTNT
jgi:hypothetical protein